MRRITLVLSLMALWVGGAEAEKAFNKAGRTSYQFLKIGIGARSAAMGEASVAHVRGASGVLVNPAALCGLSRAEASFNYVRWFADLHITAGALGLRVPEIGLFAVDYATLAYGDIQEALAFSPTGGLDTRTGQSFTGSDLAVGLSYAREFTDKLSIGVRVKYLREELFTYVNSLWAFDAGTFYDTGWRGVRLAMCAQNISRAAQWLPGGAGTRETFELPIVFRIGWSIDLLGADDLFLGRGPNGGRLTFNMDALHTNDYAERLHVGMEYELLGLLALRGGYRFNHDEGKWSLGLGLRSQLSTVELKLDYAFVAHRYLESPHRLSISLGF